MDYYMIGQRIRKYRKAYGLSQEALAEKIGISVPHMSHIETGNTKLSLPVLVAMAEALEVRTDDLLFDEQRASRDAVCAEIEGVLEDCTVRELQILNELLHGARAALKKYGLKDENGDGQWRYT